MEKSKDGCQTISRKVKRQITALLSIALLMALAVVPINAQVACLGICEQNLAQCLRNQGSGLNFSASCLEIYEQCVDACLGSTGALLGCNDEEQPRFAQNATLTYYPDSAASPLERMLKLSVDRSAIRFDRTTSDKDQSFLFNGQTLVRTTYQAGTQLEVKILNDTDAAWIRFQIATLGLLPILKRLSDVRTQVLYVGATSKTSVGFWYFYTQPNWANGAAHFMRKETKG